MIVARIRNLYNLYLCTFSPIDKLGVVRLTLYLALYQKYVPAQFYPRRFYVSYFILKNGLKKGKKSTKAGKEQKKFKRLKRKNDILSKPIYEYYSTIYAIINVLFQVFDLAYVSDQRQLVFTMGSVGGKFQQRYLVLSSPFQKKR